MSFKKSTAREYFESVVIAVILALFIRTWVVQAFKIPTGSMEQNLLIGDHLLVNKFVFGPTKSEAERFLLPMDSVERGDIVVFKYPDDPERDFIKRVIGLPGEMLEISDKRIFINGKRLYEPYLRNQISSVRRDLRAVEGRDNYGPVTVPAGHYFVMGDNRDNSQDSRFWGPLPRSYLRGRAMMVYWSYEAGPELISGGGLGAAIRRLSSVVVHFFTRTRWDRTFRQVRNHRTFQDACSQLALTRYLNPPCHQGSPRVDVSEAQIILSSAPGEAGKSFNLFDGRTSARANPHTVDRNAC